MRGPMSFLPLVQGYVDARAQHSLVEHNVRHTISKENGIRMQHPLPQPVLERLLGIDTARCNSKNLMWSGYLELKGNDAYRKGTTKGDESWKRLYFRLYMPTKANPMKT